MSVKHLYSSTLKQRELAAAGYTVFPRGAAAPRAWRAEWEELAAGRDLGDGSTWPIELRDRCTERIWPQHAFGTANAGVLVLWHRPRSAATTHSSETPHWTDPRTPVLGGIPHTQIAGWSPGPAGVGWTPAWTILREYLTEALKPFDLKHSMTAVMVAALNPAFGVPGDSDHDANIRALQPGGAVEHIVDTVRPLLTLVCGGPVQKAVRRVKWKPAFGEVRCADHPTAWKGYGSGRRHGEELVVPMFAEWAETGSIP